jgi:hypothetical protein
MGYYQFYVERRIGPGGTIFMEVVLYPLERHPRRAPAEMIRVQISSQDGSYGQAVRDARKLLGLTALANWLPLDNQ